MASPMKEVHLGGKTRLVAQKSAMPSAPKSEKQMIEEATARRKERAEIEKRRYDRHLRMPKRPPKPRNVPTGWEARWSENASAWFFWCPVTSATTWDVHDCEHGQANIGRIVEEKGGLPANSPYQPAPRPHSARGAVRAKTTRLARRPHSARAAEPEPDAAPRATEQGQAADRPALANPKAASRIGPHPPSSHEAMIVAREAERRGRRHRVVVTTTKREESRRKEAPWMLGSAGRPVYGPQYQHGEQAEPTTDGLRQYSSPPPGRNRVWSSRPQQRYSMRVAPALDDLDPLGAPALTGGFWRQRDAPAAPREYRHIHKAALAAGDIPDWKQKARPNHAFRAGAHVWLKNAMGKLKNGSGLFHSEDDESHLGPFGKHGRSPRAKPPQGLSSRPVGLVKAVRGNEYLVEWGVVGYVPVGMPRKMLWCTAGELLPVPMKRKLKTVTSGLKSLHRATSGGLFMMRAKSENADGAPPPSPDAQALKLIAQQHAAREDKAAPAQQQLQPQQERADKDEDDDDDSEEEDEEEQEKGRSQMSQLRQLRIDRDEARRAERAALRLGKKTHTQEVGEAEWRKVKVELKTGLKATTLEGEIAAEHERLGLSP